MRRLLERRCDPQLAAEVADYRLVAANLDAKLVVFVFQVLYLLKESGVEGVELCLEILVLRLGLF